VVDPKINLLVDPKTRSPKTDGYSIGVDHEFPGRLSASIAGIKGLLLHAHPEGVQET
jgi:hypothetical protein